MLESKDPGIKLFGKKIQLPLDGEIQEIVVDDLSSQSLREEEYDRGEVEEDEEKTEEVSFTTTVFKWFFWRCLVLNFNGDPIVEM